ncbi:MAG: hypothetical protein K8T89_12420 [Planctomycetes bacterium]|nr:hypothetical protein [Planctomycetota bacterium]
MSSWLKTYGELQRIEIADQSVLAKEILLGSYKDEDQVMNSIFERCEFILANPKRVSFFRNHFENCAFRPKKKVQASWFDNSWAGCTFYGTYISTHFGILNLLRDNNPWGDSLVKGCDFSMATMHGCSFYRTDIATIRFPAWPCVTMVDSNRHFVKWQPVLSSLKDGLLSSWFGNEGGASAVVFHWPTLAKSHKIDADPDEAKRKLETLDGILL